MNHKKQNIIFNIAVFTVIMAATCWSIFRNQDMEEVAASVKMMSMPYLVIAIALAVLYVAGEGSMICYLLKKIGEKEKLIRCIIYSFIGFFFSGITPSATGGQPMQLLYMKKDGHSVSASSVVLMTVAVIYKFVLVVIGILLFLHRSIRKNLYGYYGIYFFGLFLNVTLVSILLLVIFSPAVIRRLFYRAERIVIHLGFWKKSDSRRKKMEQFLEGYQGTVSFLKKHKKIIGITVVGTFLQRLCIFLITYVVYRGMGLSGATLTHIVLLQAAVYVAVDMIPIPGSQGITETMYKNIFKNIFPQQYLIASMCITRGVSFYFIMAVSLGVWGITYIKSKKNIRSV